MKTLRRISIAAALAALALTTTALAGSGVGSTFNLGETNSVSATSTLNGDTAAPQLTVKNTSTNTSATALSLVVATGRTPFRVNSPVKVSNLNSDQLDGKDSTYFLAKTGTAANSDKLDGLDSAGFWQAGGNAGTTPGTNFLGTTDNTALELKVDGERSLRIEPATDQLNDLFGFSPNLIAGFSGNSVTADSMGTTIGGGGATGTAGAYSNANAATFRSYFGTIGGGIGNSIEDFATTVGGGQYNSAEVGGTIAGGDHNTITGFASLATIAGGSNNTASGPVSAVLGGGQNAASGQYATTAGGQYNTASGNNSFAAGLHAKADDDGAFVWSNGLTGANVSSPGANTFSVQAAGGIWLGTTDTPFVTSGHFIDTNTGGYLSSGGVWTDNSDRSKKRDFRSVDKRSVLERIGRIPIRSWGYKAEKPTVRHIGPTAQDFFKAFGLGLDNKHISTIDEGGVALAAIQGLHRENMTLKRRVAKLERTVARLSRAR